MSNTVVWGKIDPVEKTLPNYSKLDSLTTTAYSTLRNL